MSPVAPDRPRPLSVARTGKGRFAGALSLVALSLLLAFGATPAEAAAPLKTGFMDGLYRAPDPGVRDLWFDRTVDSRAGLVRLNLSWRSVTSGQPLTPSNPADPAYNFASMDGAVQDATERGLDVLITVQSAPDFAEGPGRPGSAPPGTWKPDPTAFAAFAAAVASRYSGSFAGLPRVRYFQAWNEPNLTEHLTPQYTGGVAAAGTHYKDLLNAFYGAVKAVHADNVVVTAGTGPYGDPPGNRRTRPLAFWRDVLCLQGQGDSLGPAPCNTKASFDILAHHPINTTAAPDVPAVDPDDATIADFGEVRDTLRAAERFNTVGTGGTHPLWATELWWDSNPPDTVEGVPVKRHARWMAETLYLLWKQGASAVINLQLRDAQFNQAEPFEENTTGIFFFDGSPKPAYTAFRFPFVTERKSKRKLTAWGKSPEAGKLKIQKKKGKRWVKVKKVRVDRGEVFKKKLKLRGTVKLRAKVRGARSMPWVIR